MQFSPLSHDTRPVSWRDLWPGLAVGLVMIAGLVVATLVPRDPHHLAVLFNPALSRDAIVTRLLESGALLERHGAVPGLVVVDLASGDIDQLYQHGAWLVIDPLMAGGCTNALPNSPFIKSRGVRT